MEEAVAVLGDFVLHLIIFEQDLRQAGLQTGLLSNEKFALANALRQICLSDGMSRDPSWR